MSNIAMNGICIKEISVNLPTFVDKPEWVREYKIKKNEYCHIYHTENSDKPYRVSLGFGRHLNFEMSEQEVEEYFLITYKEGCYNTCIRNGIACSSLRDHNHKKQALDKREDWVCRQNFEIGRADCYLYESIEAKKGDN